MKLLGALEKPFYAAVDPLVERLIRAGVRPNTITTVGTGLVLASAVAYGLGHVRIGGLVLLMSGVAEDGGVRTPHGSHVEGLSAEPISDAEAAVAVFSPSAVSVYLEPPSGSPRNVFEATVTERGPEWASKMIAYVEATPFGAAHGLHGVEGMVEFWMRYGALCDALIAETRLPVLSVDTDEAIWPSIEDHVVSWLRPVGGERWTSPA